MTIRNITDLRDSLPPGGRLMGLDVGRKTIGMALSDTTRTVATAFNTIRRTKFGDDAETLRRLVAEYGVAAFVIGLPVSMDGSEGPMCQSVRQFGDNVDAALGIDIAFWDERLSTAAITRTLLEADASRERRREVKDKLAAAYILQGALDRLRG
ncbi:MAG: Holliday junction resolvase RuvX [Acetobacterales bacterium]